jgi:hypothetical protein
MEVVILQFMGPDGCWGTLTTRKCGPKTFFGTQIPAQKYEKMIRELIFSHISQGQWSDMDMVLSGLK